MSNVINDFIKEYEELHSYLVSQKQVSYASDLDRHYKKILIFSCASYFEYLISDSIKRLSMVAPKELQEFIYKKAINRQYHTYFAWNESSVSSINPFLSLWGNDFKVRTSKKIKEDKDLSQGAIDFIEIGRERNIMAHENFMEYETQKTFDEVEKLFVSAEKFVRFIMQEIGNLASNV